MPTEWKTKNLKVKDLLQVDGNLSVSGSSTTLEVSVLVE